MPKEGQFMAHMPQPASHWLEVSSGLTFPSHPPQCLSNSSKLLMPLRALFEGDWWLIVALTTSTCCTPAIWWTFLQTPETRASQTLWVTWGCCENANLDSVTLKWGPRFYISDKFCRPHFEQQALEDLGPGLRDWRKRQRSNSCVEISWSVPSPLASATQVGLSMMGAAICTVTSLLLRI